MPKTRVSTFNAPLVATLCVFLAILVDGCTVIPIDPSMNAAEAGDYVLATSACDAVPGGGLDVCRVVEGTKIDSNWTLIVPAGFGSVVGGELNVYYRDVQRSYPVTDKVVRIPWADFFRASTWSSDMDGEALALLVLKYKDAQGIEKVQEFRGIAKIVVTKSGYSRLPIDSGYAAWKTECKIQYSSAGRGAISCR